MTSKNRTIGKLLTTSNVDLYEVPANYETNVKSIFVNNASSSFAYFSLDWYDAQTDTWHTVAESVPVVGNAMLQITQSLWLYKGDKFRGLCDAADSITLVFNIEEFYIPTRP